MPPKGTQGLSEKWWGFEQDCDLSNSWNPEIQLLKNEYTDLFL